MIPVDFGAMLSLKLNVRLWIYEKRYEIMILEGPAFISFSNISIYLKVSFKLKHSFTGNSL